MHYQRLRKNGSPTKTKTAQKGEGTISKDGYRLVRAYGRQYPEHRLVMEQIIGRRLGPEEVVHHINGDRLDNRPENLMLFANQAEHIKHHMELGDYPQVKGGSYGKLHDTPETG